MNAVVRDQRLDFRRLPALAKRQIDSAKLTPMYEDAKRSLAALSKVDEVKEIADKHSAIAHYAKQIKDNSLMYYAERVYARALARIGELLEELSPKDRAEAAKQHGISAADAGHAVNIAALSKRALDTLIEKEPPAKKGELSRKGAMLRRPADARPRPAFGWQAYVNKEPYERLRLSLICLAETLSEEAKCDYDRFGFAPIPVSTVDTLRPDEAEALRDIITPLIEYMDALDQRLELRAAGK